MVLTSVACQLEPPVFPAKAGNHRRYVRRPVGWVGLDSGLRRSDAALRNLHEALVLHFESPQASAVPQIQVIEEFEHL